MCMYDEVKNSFIINLTTIPFQRQKNPTLLRREMPYLFRFVNCHLLPLSYIGWHEAI